MARIDGFDVASYPGDDLFRQMRQFGFRVVCFYLAHKPGHPDTTWSRPRRDRLANQGWGFLPTYAGLQIGSHSLSAAHGRQHADEAMQYAASAGFLEGSVLYLDLEDGTVPSGAYADYVTAWIARVKAGNYMPALYCSHLLTTWAFEHVDVVWSFRIPSNTKGKTYDPSNLPSARIDARCIATQYRQEIKLRGVDLPPSADRGIDLDLCAVADPSHVSIVSHRLRLDIA